ncbi:MAG: hypothetical protein WBI07_16605, partial [Mobilitalea sp.]
KSIEKSTCIEIYHYNIRGLDHFKNKMINGGKSIEQNIIEKKNVAEHWRYFYDGWVKGEIDLDLEYDRVIGKKYQKEFINKGILVNDDTIKQHINNIEGHVQ